MSSVFLNLGVSLEYIGADYMIVLEEQLIPKTHEYLFRFLEADFSRLEAYTRNYLACIDVEKPENSTCGDPLILQRIFEELFNVHPYYREAPSAVSAYVNLVLAGYVTKVFPNDVNMQTRIFDLICIERYLGRKTVEYWVENPIPVTKEHLFISLYELQQNIARWVFLALDNTNPVLEKLSSQQRNAVYSLIFGGDFLPPLETRVEKSMLHLRSLESLSAAMETDEDFKMELFRGIAYMQKNATAPVPESVLKVVSAAERITEDCECHTYFLETFDDLLKYEVYGMTQNHIHIKRCKYCGHYFVHEKDKQEYCDRIIPGEIEPCNEIGKARTSEKRITGGSSAKALYRKAYKTHFARTRTGNMTQDAFDLWKAEASEKRRQAEQGALEFAKYAVWLKQ